MSITSISISDENLLFSSGLRFIYLNHYGKKVNVEISPACSNGDRVRNSVKVYYSDGDCRSIKIESSQSLLINIDEDCIYRCDEVKDIIRKTNGWGLELKNHLDVFKESALVRLTPSEIQTVILFCSGNDISKIALSLNKSVKTISSNKRNVMKKMKIKSDQDLYKWYGLLF